MKAFFSEKTSVALTFAMAPVLLAFLTVHPFRGVARAESAYTDPYAQTLNDVEFNAVPAGTDSYSLVFDNISFGSVYNELLFKTGSSDAWTLLATPATQTAELTGLTGPQSIWLEISDGTNYLTAGNLQFMGRVDANLFNSLNVAWQLPDGVTGFNLSTVAPGGSAHLSPVAIPSSGVLFGSGLLGLIGLVTAKGRRKRASSARGCQLPPSHAPDRKPFRPIETATPANPV